VHELYFDVFDFERLEAASVVFEHDDGKVRAFQQFPGESVGVHGLIPMLIDLRGIGN
jgi:hypothetical protein